MEHIITIVGIWRRARLLSHHAREVHDWVDLCFRAWPEHEVFLTTSLASVCHTPVIFPPHQIDHSLLSGLQVPKVTL